MNPPAMVSLKKKSIVSLTIVRIALISFVAFLITIIYFSPSKIFSAYWHWKNPNPISWRNFQIHVPENFVAKKFLKPEELDLMIFKFDGDTFINLDYLRTEKDFSDNSVAEVFSNNLIAHLHEKGFKNTEKANCKIENDLCIRIQSEKINEGTIRIREDILFLKSKVWLKFDGYPDNRKEFNRIVDTLKILNNYGTR